MVNVVFVGDEPSDLNISPEIPFVGAKSFKRLVQWINYIKPDYYVVLNSSASEDIVKILNLYNNGFKIITLGEKASKRLNGLVEFAGLPHPSGRNLQVNDIAEMGIALGRAKDYVQCIA